MNLNLKTAAAVAFMGFGVLLSGCSQNTGPEGKHSIAWYTKHTNARHKERNWCKRLPTKDHWSVSWSKSPAGVACCEAREGGKVTQYDIKHGYLEASQIGCQG